MFFFLFSFWTCLSSLVQKIEVFFPPTFSSFFLKTPSNFFLQLPRSSYDIYSSCQCLELVFYFQEKATIQTKVLYWCLFLLIVPSNSPCYMFCYQIQRLKMPFVNPEQTVLEVPAALGCALVLKMYSLVPIRSLSGFRIFKWHHVHMPGMAHACVSSITGTCSVSKVFSVSRS